VVESGFGADMLSVPLLAQRPSSPFTVQSYPIFLRLFTPSPLWFWLLQHSQVVGSTVASGLLVLHTTTSICSTKRTAAHEPTLKNQAPHGYAVHYSAAQKEIVRRQSVISLRVA
jgi:hypothetical protein